MGASMRTFQMVLMVLAVSIQAQTITEPRSAEASGGINVTLRGSGFLRSCDLIACPPDSFQASFGDTPAKIVSIRDDEILLLAPPHRPGRTMILVSSPGFLIANDPLFQYVADLNSFPRGTVLLPLIWSGETPGAYGSRWVSFFTVYDRQKGKLAFDSPYLPRAGDTNPSRFFSLGAVLGFSWDFSERATMQLHIQDISRQAETFGVEIPIVRDTDLHVERVTLSDVPTEPRSRVALRVYMVNGMRETGSVSMPFRLRIFPAEGETPIVEDLIHVATPYATDLKFPPEPLYPAIYQNHDLVLSYPALANYPRVRVEVEPIGLLSGNRVPLFWAFASVAHKESQRVTVISPQ
jgi:hypothetical protein